MTCSTLHAALPALALSLTSAISSAQASFQEDFDSLSAFAPGQLGPDSLVQQGWIFRNQNGGAFPPEFTWRDGPYYLTPCGVSTAPAQAGPGCLSADWRSLTNGTAISDWAILPPIPGLTAGDEISLFVLQHLFQSGTRVEIRYSPSGGTDAGTGPTDVGDFTQILTGSTAPPANWTFRSATVPGAGRLAIRYFATGQIGQCAWGISVDSLRVGPPAPPCPTYPQIPSAGQTVTWTAAGSPYHICTTSEIPAGATVIVESGAFVTIDAGSVLEVRGDLRMQPGSRLETPFDSAVRIRGRADFTGTISSPVLMTGGPGSHGTNSRDQTEVMPGGILTMEHVDLQTTVGAIGSGVVVATHVETTGPRSGFFLDGRFGEAGGQLRISQSSFKSESELNCHGGYVWIDDVTFDGGRLVAYRAWGGQTMLLDGLDARDRPLDSPFRLTGGDFHFGPDNLIENNRYPVTMIGAGLSSGSLLPTSGNAVNRAQVEIPFGEGKVHWARLPIPYQVDWASPAATVAHSIDVEPGTHILLDPGAGIRAVEGSILNLEGLPEAPIVFDQALPGSRWFGLHFAEAPVDARLEYVTVRGAEYGLLLTDTVLRVESSLLEDNLVGVLGGTSARAEVRGTRFFQNDTGVRMATTVGLNSLAMNADTLPNWLEGNGIGLETVGFPSIPHQARGNYWGDPSGPQHVSNPGGQGDAAIGVNVVLPFEVTAPGPPSRPGHAPIVRLERHSDLLDEGSKVVIHWTARDDGYITRFRVIHAPHGTNSPHTVLADGLPGTTRSVEIVVPQAPPASNYTDPSLIRIEAYDDTGKYGWDEMSFTTPYLNGFVGGLQPDPLPGVATPGQTYRTCGTYFGGLSTGASWESEIWFDADDQQIPSGVGVDSCAILDKDLPAFSTDLARFVTRYTAGAQGMVTYSFSDYFTIRPNGQIGDAPPQVNVVAPLGGATYASDDVLRVRWTASDDEGLRGFDLQASYDCGRTWSTVTHGLEPNARSFDWKLPRSTGIADVRMRVVARDHRFQNSSSTSAPFSLGAAIGTRSCAAVANSTGKPGITTAGGRRSVLSNDLTLHAWQLPIQSTTFFLASRTSGFSASPGGSQGNLCLAGSIGRYVGPGQVLNSGADGHVELSIDLSAMPTPNGPVPAFAGETWHFTAWHRDFAVGSATSNFADALSIEFLP